MKIGDMVVRAYAYHAFIPGIIVDEELEHHPDGDDFVAHTDHNFIVAWSDGSTSREMDVELDYLEDAFEAIQGLMEEDEQNESRITE